MDNAKELDVVKPIYNLIEYNNNYAKVSGSLWQYYKDDPNYNISDSESFKFKAIITGRTLADGNTKDVEITVSLKYLSNFWRLLEMPQINCEINFILTWSASCVITDSTNAETFKMKDIPTATIGIRIQLNNQLE